MNGNIWNSFRFSGLPDSSNRVAKYAFFLINFGLIDLGTWILCLYQHFRGWGIEWKYFENWSALRVARSIQQGCQISVFNINQFISGVPCDCAWQYNGWGLFSDSRPKMNWPRNYDPKKYAFFGYDVSRVYLVFIHVIILYILHVWIKS